MTLTREQVGQALNNAVDHGEVDDADYQAIMDTDAALRQELEDVPTLRGDLGMLMTQLKERDSIIDQLRQRVEALEKECQGYYGEASKGWT